MIRKYIKKPVEIEACQFTGDNIDEIIEFTNGKAKYVAERHPYGARYCIIPTLEGEFKAVLGDYIIKGVQGEFYSCKPWIFDMSYQLKSE